MTRPPRAAESEPEIGGIILAAGEGRRFGGAKQLAPLNGRPLIEHALEAMLAVPALDPVVIVLGAHADRIRGGRPRCGRASPRSARSRRRSSRSPTSLSSRRR